MKVLRFFLFFLIFVGSDFLKVSVAQGQERSRLADKDFVAALIPDVQVSENKCFDNSQGVNDQPWYLAVKNMQLSYNARRIVKNILLKLSDPGKMVLGSRGRTWSKYNKITVKLQNNACTFVGKYRLTGDLDDHIGGGTSFLHSMKIKLKHDNIGGITKFKLFNPKARNGKYEVLNSVIHNELGFLAPRTALLPVVVGENVYEVVFQEEIDGNFLFANGYHEGPILEGDENLLSIEPRIVNKGGWPKNVHTQIMRQSSRLFKSTVVFWDFGGGKDNWREVLLEIDSFDKDSRDNFTKFHLLNFGLDSQGGLTPDDHRMFYDQISRQFFPIYYDGHPREKELPINVNFDFSEQERTALIRQIRAVNIEKMIIQLEKQGAIFGKDEIEKILDRVVTRIKAIEMRASKNLVRRSVSAISSQDYIRILLKLINSTGGHKIENPKFWWIDPNNMRVECSASDKGIRCSSFMSDEDGSNRQHIVSQSTPPPIRLSALEDNASNHLQKVRLYTFELLGNVKIEVSNGIIPILDENKKIIQFERIFDPGFASHVRFFDGSLNDWEIKVAADVGLGYEAQEESRSSNLGYTGCLIFNDMKVENLRVSIEGAACEDAVHFVRVDGSVENIFIRNADFDGVDADFSNLSFLDVDIQSAGNDCIDLSAGKYQLYQAVLLDCGDKAISVGELSVVSIERAVAERSMIGVAVKDRSQLRLGEAHFKDTKLCMAVYQKKRAFGPARLIYEDVVCGIAPSFSDSMSLLLKKNL